MSQQRTIQDTRPIRAFLDPKITREQALRAFPQLKGAYEVQDKLADTLAHSKPLTQETGRDVSQLIRNTIAKDLVNGREPQATPKLHEAVKVQVAVKNLHTVEEAHREHPARAPELPPENRQTLVKHAEVAMTLDPQGAIRRAGAYASSERFEAYQVAHSVAKLDFIKQNLSPTPERNPFKEPQLAAVYKNEQSFQVHTKDQIAQGEYRGRYESPYRFDASRPETRSIEASQPPISRGLER